MYLHSSDDILWVWRWGPKVHFWVVKPTGQSLTTGQKVHFLSKGVFLMFYDVLIILGPWYIFWPLVKKYFFCPKVFFWCFMMFWSFWDHGTFFDHWSKFDQLVHFWLNGVFLMFHDVLIILGHTYILDPWYTFWHTFSSFCEIIISLHDGVVV